MNSEIQILLLEDDLELLEALGEVLQDAGYSVCSVSNSQQAVELSIEREFDVVITDIRMAGMDGLDALARVRQVQPEVRSLVVTGYSSEADTIRALRLGVGEYLNKPFRLEAFREAVERLVDQVRQIRSRAHLEQSLRKLMVWALENFADRPEVRQDLPWAGKAAQLSYDLALRMELGEEGGEAVQLACLYDLLRKRNLPAFVGDSLPRRVSAIFQAEQGLELNVLDAAMHLAQEAPLPDSLPRNLRLAAEMLHELPSGTEAPPQQKRHSLSLALALEQAGEMEAAVKAYQAVLSPPPSREAVLAAQGLAWLAHRLGRAKQVRDFSLQGVNISRHLGPLSLASTACDAGVLLAAVAAPEAAEVLEEAELLNGRLDFRARQALAQLALSWVRGSEPPAGALAVLQQPSAQSELTDGVWWLAPFLLEQAASNQSGELQKLLQRILAENAQTIHKLVTGGRLSAPARQALARMEPTADILKALAVDADQGVRDLASRAMSTAHAERSVPLLRLFSLGFLETFFGEVRLPDEVFKRNQKARHMLAYLALERGRPVSEEVLMDLFWPGEGSAGRKNLYSIRSIWRKSLQPPGETLELEPVVRTAAGLMMNPEMNWWHDLEELRRCLESAERFEKSQQTLEALNMLRRAAQLYRGPFLEGCYLDWATTIREQTEFAMIQALLKLADLTLANNASESLEVCLRVLELDNCSQEAYRTAMQAFLEMNRPLEAIRLYERCVKVTQRELQAEPAIPVVEMYHRARLAL